MIKTFRGLLADGDQEVIRLSRNDGLMGYKIIKFQGFFEKPGTVEQESLLKVLKVEDGSVPTAAAEVNFDNMTLMAVWFSTQHTSPAYNNPIQNVVFDREIVNQDIYITHTDQPAGTGESCNYYLELEEIPLNLNEATVATLKDMRGRE